MLYTLAALAILPCSRAIRTHLGAKLLLEGAATLGALAYMVSGVKWIVG